ncbi:hypothetical protein Tsubulata_023521 [Turnera subulata]|uniref:VQ domain-containing protein n=1 Tax=Turnera subulata TaxID=218843 RepID=A0A9Q0JPJ0_9ROSI|nr:hypothetical protein Tsubulata_023521 [Turnera subulata]
MASSENLASLDPWAFRAAFPDSWISESYARDTETLTKALQKSLSAAAAASSSADSFNPFLGLLDHHQQQQQQQQQQESATTAPPTPTASTLSGSDPEAPPALSKRPRTAVPGPNGKVSKRKSRASKRSQTTFITADPANFRQMVQQVTGVRFGGNSQLPVVPVLKPEPHRPPPGGRSVAAAAAACLPTLDTSAFLLDQHQLLLGSVSGPGLPVGSGPQSFGTQPQTLPADSGTAAAAGGGGFGFDTFSGFPTLESWKVM